MLEFSVTKNGKKLPESKYTWDEETRVFTTKESDLIIDFSDIHRVTFKTGLGCTFKTGCNCTFNTGADCTFNTGAGCTFDTGSDCTFNTSYSCTFKTGYNCTFRTGFNCTFKTGFNCTFDTDSRCTFDTDLGCTFKTGSNCAFSTGSKCTFNTDSVCTFKTGSKCTFKTGSGCAFKTDSDCTFKTDSDCTFYTYPDCTFDTGSNCTFNTSYGCTFNTSGTSVIVRNDTNEVIRLKAGITYMLCPFAIKGYLTKLPDENAFYKEINGERVEHIIADDILSKVIKKKGNVYHVKNYKSKKVTYLIKDGDIYSHGDTLEEAKESLQYKISSRDTSEFEKYTLDDELDKVTLIRAYRTITGACEGGTKYFCEHTKIPARLTVRKAIRLTKGQYNSELFEEFFTRKYEV